jgi:O-Antigen ligase
MNVLLAFALVMTSATQLDLPGVDMTVGELALLAWVFLMLMKLLASGSYLPGPAFNQLGKFWIVFAAMLSVGFVHKYLVRLIDTSSVSHDAVAYVLLASLTCLSAGQYRAKENLTATLGYLVLFADVACLIQIALSFNFVNLPGVDPFYWGRLRGWSQNPNQTGLYCALFGPMAIHLITTTNRRWIKMAALAGIVLPAYVGIMSQSDTYILASGVTLAMFFTLTTVKWLAAGDQSKLNTISALAVLLVMTCGFLLVPMVTSNYDSSLDGARSLSKDQSLVRSTESAARRIDLWKEAVDQGVGVALFGLGPGAHLETRPDNDPSYVGGPYEAHNTYLDLYLQGGIVAVGLLLWIGFKVISTCWRSQRYALLCLVVTIALFGIPHLVIRHPIVWFSIVLAMVLGAIPNARPVLPNVSIPVRTPDDYFIGNASVTT